VLGLANEAWKEIDNLEMQITQAEALEHQRLLARGQASAAAVANIEDDEVEPAGGEKRKGKRKGKK